MSECVHSLERKNTHIRAHTHTHTHTLTLQVVLRLPWDEHLLQNYRSDCDSYMRWRLAGYELGNLDGIHAHLEVVHLADVPDKQ